MELTVSIARPVFGFCVLYFGCIVGAFSRLGRCFLIVVIASVEELVARVDRDWVFWRHRRSFACFSLVPWLMISLFSLVSGGDGSRFCILHLLGCFVLGGVALDGSATVAFSTGELIAVGLLRRSCC